MTNGDYALTQEERNALEQFIGFGLMEVGGPFSADLPVFTACRKLGLTPKDWQRNDIVPEEG